MTCDHAIKAYLATVQAGFSCVARPNGRLCVVTPYLYPDHDNIEVFVRPKDARVFVSDLGETLRYLDTNGMDIMSTPNLLFAARRIADGFGVEIREGVLVKDGPPEAVGQLIFDVLSAVRAVASLLYRNRSYEPRTFDDEVAAFLESHDLSVVRPVPITGQSGTPYKVMRVQAPQRSLLLQTVAPRKPGGVRYAVNATFRMWSDINGEFTDKDKKASVLNDGAVLFREEDVALLERVSRVYRWTNPTGIIAALKGDATAPV